MTPAPALDLTTSLRGDFLFLWHIFTKTQRLPFFKPYFTVIMEAVYKPHMHFTPTALMSRDNIIHA